MDAVRWTRRPSVLRTIGLAAAAAAVTGACAAGQLAQTANQRPSIDGNNATVGRVDLRAVSIQAPEGRANYAAGSNAPLKIVIVNNARSTDTLTGVSTPAATSWGAYADAAAAETPSSSAAALPSFSDSETGVIGAPSSGGASSGSSSSASSSTGSAPAGGKQSVEITSQHRVGFGVPDSDAALVLTGLKKALYPGNTISITFTFAKAGDVTVSVPVQIATGDEGSPAVVPGGNGDEGGE